MKGIILAGGYGTRLGPVGAQLNKALVNFGGRPMLVNQITAMRGVGCDEFVVVVSPRWKHQVSLVMQRAFGDMIKWDVTVQSVPSGPSDAVTLGAEHFTDDGPVIVIMADTFVNADDLKQAMRLRKSTHQWTGVRFADGGRSWCWLDHDVWRDSYVEDKALVAIGCYHFPSVQELAHKGDLARSDRGNRHSELPMSPLLNMYDPSTVIFTSWRDTGDATTLAQSRKTFLRSRSFNTLTMTDDGFVHKAGRVYAERKYLRLIEDCHLFPRTRGGGDEESYEIEYVDSPTLAELFLYWSSTPGLWTHIAETVLDQVDSELWCRTAGDEKTPTNQMAVTKAADRVLRWSNSVMDHERLEINGVYHDAGREVLGKLATKGQTFNWSSDDVVFPHGDLNFTNILYSLGNDIVRLIDPRGDTALDKHYDLAKFRYSYNGFAAISHGLFDVECAGQTHKLRFTYRKAEPHEMDDVLREYGDLDKIKWLESLLFIAGAPLHEGEEGLALYLRGLQLAREVLA